jgi:RimJ/RimL family protein N-acetyltransferase
VYRPFLAGDKVYLRALEREDLKGNMFQWANDPEVTHYMYMGTFPNTREALQREYELLTANGGGSILQHPVTPGNVVLAVVDRKEDVHIGNVGFFGISWLYRTAEFRTIIGERAYWGGGHASEAYCLAIEYAFDRLNLRKLWGGCREDNFPAVMALKRVGFVQEGRLREQILRNEQAYDVIMFGLLREEFFSLFPKSGRRSPSISIGEDRESS